jgi:Fe2+ transport system protein FeoA
MHDLIPLSFLVAGQSAKVGEIVGEPSVVQRLEEMGLRKGTVLEMLSPGRLCLVRIGGHKYCFRGDETTHILVHREALT